MPAPQRAAVARQVARQVERHLHLRPGARIGIYLAMRQELDTAPLIELARRRRCRIYVPRIEARRSGRKMRFIELTGALRSNHLGILEPAGARFLNARCLELVFVPLVGFDRRGVRLGMGGGYYDRAFAFRRWRTRWHAPRLIGLAYSFQEVEALTPAVHDVRLDGVVTERGMIPCSAGF